MNTAVSSPLQFPESPVIPSFVASSKNDPISTCINASQGTTSGDTVAVDAVDQNQGFNEPQHEPTTISEPSGTPSQNHESLTHETQTEYTFLHDEDNAELLVISPSKYEVSFKFDTPEDTEEEQNQRELEEEQDEDISLALTSGKVDLLSQINPDLIDPEMIHPNYCNVCGVSLRSDYHLESSEPDPEFVNEAATVEVYITHATSEKHSVNILLCRRLAEANELYKSLQHSVNSLLQDYKEYHYDSYR